MTIILQTNTSETRAVTKNLTTIATKTGTLRQETSIIDPVFTVAGALSDFVGCNYCTVADFGRSYFVRNIRSIRTGLVELTCHVDVLSSFANEIKANRGIVRRSQSADTYNLMINDGSLTCYQDPYILTEPFPDGFTGTTFVLAVAGG